MSRYLNLFSVFLAYIIVEGYIKFERKSIYIINVCKKEGYFIIPILSFITIANPTANLLFPF